MITFFDRAIEILESFKSDKQRKAVMAKMGRAKRGSSPLYDPKAYILDYVKKKNIAYTDRSGKKKFRRELSGPKIYQEGKLITNKSLIKKIMVLPFRKDLTEVHISPNPKSSLIAVGKDAKGKTQYCYSQEHSVKGTQTKFNREKEFANILPKIEKQISADLKSKNPVIFETALALKLISETGIRVGTEGFATGATTLRMTDVSFSGNKLKLDFMGKSGVRGKYTISQPDIVSGFKRITKNKKSKDWVFNNISAGNVNSFLKNFSSSTVKDYRTHIASRDAFSLSQSLAKKLGKNPSKGALKSAYRNILVAVSTKLNNTPTVAKKSYINPVSFAPLVALGLDI